MYDWEGKEGLCRQLYVEQNKSLDEVLETLKKEGFAPSKRALQTQFRRWNFPLKYHSHNNDEELRNRIRELWEDNTRQREMLRILEEEGYVVKERELMRVRARNGWLLKESRLHAATPSKSNGPRTGRKRKPVGYTEEPLSDRGGESGRALTRESVRESEDDSEDEDQVRRDTPTDRQSIQRKKKIPQDAFKYPDLTITETPEQAMRRQQRLAELQAESDEKWKSGKRRRRTRAFVGIEPDPVGPPRFPSETTIDESKVALKINDNSLYRKIRDEFQTICEEAGIKKKTDVGPERWQTAKDQLIAQSPHLQAVFYGPDSNAESFEHKQLCLDVICLDVTKRMRTMGTRMTLLEARKLLKLNPEQTRNVRGIFYAILKNDNYISKTLTGEERMNELKEQWLAETNELRDLYNDGDPDGTKKKAIDVLAKDIMKRLRDDMHRLGGKEKPTSGPSGGPGPAPPRYDMASKNYTGPSAAERTAAMALAATANDGLDTLAAASDLQIDPTLLLAAEHMDDHVSERQSAPTDIIPSIFSYPLLGPAPPNPGNAADARLSQPSPPTVSPIPVFFHLVRTTSSQALPKPDWWMDMLQHFTMAELQQKVREKHPSTSVMQIRGELDNGKTTVRDDESLRSYLVGVEIGRARLGIMIDLA